MGTSAFLIAFTLGVLLTSIYYGEAVGSYVELCQALKAFLSFMFTCWLTTALLTPPLSLQSNCCNRQWPISIGSIVRGPMQARKRLARPAMGSLQWTNATT
jgi:hypothetical protein